MRNAFNKEVVRAIVQTGGRFLAIVVISLLGAGFYAGLRMAAPGMRTAGDEFFDGGNLFDISVMTTLGLDDESVGLLEGVEGVGAVMPAYRADAMVLAGKGSHACAVESLPVDAARASDASDGVNARSGDVAYLNRPVLVEGDWPASGAADECVVGERAARDLGIHVGDAVAIEKVEGDLSDTFATTRFTVAGLVNSAAYASSSTLGTARLGTGELECYLYVPASAFADDLPYSVAYLSVPAARDAQWGSDAYDRAVADVKERVQGIAGELAEKRQQAVKDQLHFELAGVIQELSASLDWADDIEAPDVFVLDRAKNAGAASLASDADGITQIATFLPFMFFLVAALVSLTSMTRMVDEERLVIGTHKALGYGRARITSKYLLYGALASGAGSAAGVFTLGKLLPWFILTSYQVSYAVPGVPLPVDAGVAARAIGLSVGVTVVATWWAAAATLRAKPAALMVPRAPKAGKRIVLERVAPVWRRMSFSQKVTARNLLRYKRRLLMVVVGVAGCTALLMIGFGLRDAIGGIVASQYEELVRYDAAVRLDDGASANERADVAGALDRRDVDDVLFADDFTMIAKGASDDLRVEVVVPESTDRLGDFVVLRDRESGQALSQQDDAVVLTEKAARVLGVNVGDAVQLYDEDDVGDARGEPRSFRVGGIAENYLGHYAYLTAAGYEAEFGEDAKFNQAFVKLAAGADLRAFSDDLLAQDGVATVSFVADKMGTYEDMLDVMNKLIYVIVLLSAALAFVVLYNLTNINIDERVREVATLKVLGFTRAEVNAYVFREVLVMTFAGALVGCVAGVPATFYIAEAAETANMMFGRGIEPASFVFSFLLTMAFAVIVAFTMRGKLARISMVESLKSVE